MEPGAFVTLLERLWSRSGLLLWALATACLIAFVGLVIGARVDPATFGTAMQSSEVWLLPLGLALLVLAAFRSFYEKAHPPLRIVPIENQFYVHPAKQQDGRMTVQIVGRFEIYNLSDQPIVLIDIKPIKPRITGKMVNRMVDVKDTESQYSGRYPVPPRTVSNGSFMLIAYQDVSSLGSEVDVVVKVSDQFGRWHKIAVKRARKN